MSVPDEASAEHGKHRTQQHHGFFIPHEKTIETIPSGLVDTEMTATDIVRSVSQGWLAPDLPVRKVDKLLRFQMHEDERSHHGDYWNPL